MPRLTFTTPINATAAHVWFALWDDVHYRKWTSAFCEGSYMITDLKEGSKVHFLSPSGGGMYSKVTQNLPPQKMCFTHIGEIKNFEEQALDEAAQAWTGSQENYTLTENEGVTTVLVEVDALEAHFEYFQDAFPKGLAVLKESAENLYITVTAEIAAPIEKVWAYWTENHHITQWNNASPDWHCPKAENDLKVGGKFVSVMAAKDGSFSFDFGGIYDEVELHKRIAYTLEDGRKVSIDFIEKENHVFIQENFQAESTNTLELQRDGWQAILNNFKQYVSG